MINEIRNKNNRGATVFPNALLRKKAAGMYKSKLNNQFGSVSNMYAHELFRVRIAVPEGRTLHQAIVKARIKFIEIATKKYCDLFILNLVFANL